MTNVGPSPNPEPGGMPIIDMVGGGAANAAIACMGESDAMPCPKGIGHPPPLVHMVY